jgi:Serine/threonine protein phosphatase 2A, regulatory subunit
MCIRVFQRYVKYCIVLSSSSVFPADIISCVEFNHDGDLLATGDKGGRVVIFQRDPIVSILTLHTIPLELTSSKK